MSKPYYGVYYRNECGEFELCEFDGGVCFEAFRSPMAANESAEKANRFYKVACYVVRPIPAGTKVCDRAHDTIVTAGEHAPAAPVQRATRARYTELRRMLRDNGNYAQNWMTADEYATMRPVYNKGVNADDLTQRARELQTLRGFVPAHLAHTIPHPVRLVPHV